VRILYINIFQRNRKLCFSNHRSGLLRRSCPVSWMPIFATVLFLYNLFHTRSLIFSSLVFQVMKRRTPREAARHRSPHARRPPAAHRTPCNNSTIQQLLRFPTIQLLRFPWLLMISPNCHYLPRHLLLIFSQTARARIPTPRPPRCRKG
jgi:hypothetical protein